MTQWDAITAAISRALQGDDEEVARRELAACWEQTTAADHAQRCVIAHYLADLQRDLVEEIAWDERALAAYAHVVDTNPAPIGIPAAGALAPSLHLNLGDGYLRQGRLGDAQTQLEAGLAAQDALADDGYGALIRRGLAGLRQRIQSERATAST